MGAIPMDSGWALVLVVAAGFFLMPGSDGRADGDFWWHLLYGQWVLERHEIPAVDWLSWTMDGGAYTVTQWLGQVLIAMGWEFAGWKGTALVTWVATMTVVIMSYLVARREISHSAIAALLALAMTTPFWSSYARPQIFGFACMGILVWLVERVTSRELRKLDVALIAATMIAWTNVHGSYVIGLVYLGAVIVSYVIDGAFNKGEDQKKKVMVLGVLMVMATLATLVNPFGIGAWQYVVEISGLQTTKLGVITEWNPTSLGTPQGSTFVLMSLALLVAWGIGDVRPKVRDVVMFVGMFLVGMMAVRQTYFATVAMVPIAARCLTGQSMTSMLATALPRKVGGAIWLGAIAVALVVGQAQSNWRNRGVEHWQSQVFPVSATQFLEKHEIKGRLFNEATAGGWMAFHGSNKVFIDGRLDLFGDRGFFDWYFTRQGAPGWDMRLAQTDPEIFVIQTQSPLTSLLIASGKAAVVYSDTKYSVLLKRQERFAVLIEKLEIKDVPFVIFGPKGEVLPSLGGW